MILGFDGYDDYTVDGDTITYGIAYLNTATLSTNTRTGSGKCLYFNGSNYKVGFQDQGANELFITFIVNRETSVAWEMFNFGKSSTNEPQLQVEVDVTGRFVLKRGATTLATGNQTIMVGGWYCIEARIKVDNTSGIFQLKINSLLDIDFAGDTQNLSTNELTMLHFTANAGFRYYLDDLGICNNAGTKFNTWLGERREIILSPNADVTVQFSRSIGSVNYGNVNSLISSPGTDYNYDNVVGNKDILGVEDLGFNIASGSAVKVVTTASKDDVNPRLVKFGIKSGTTEQKVEHSLSQSDVTYLDYFETSDGSADFTTATINSLNLLYEISG